MAHLLAVVLIRTDHLPELLATWQRIGVPGVTILESAGGYRTANWLERVGLGGIGDLFRSEAAQSKTLMAVIEDDDVLKKAIDEAERIMGDFFQPERGLLFVMPVTQVLGLIKQPVATVKETAGTSQAGPLLESDARAEQELFTRDTPVSTANEVLKLEPVIVQSNQPLIEVVGAMVLLPIVQEACVVDANQRLVGLLPLKNLADDLFMAVAPEEFLSEARDLEEVLQFAKLSRTQTAADAMIPPVWVKEEESLRDAFRKMHENHLTGIPIINQQHEVIGHINLLELLAVYAGSQTPSEDQAGSTNE